MTDKNHVPTLSALGIKPEVVVAALPEDERLWVPQAQDVWFRPLLFDTLAGSWCNLLRVRKGGILNRHRHPAMVLGYVIKGSWHYLEHDWMATAGSFVYEPPGEIHTLVVDDADEMITLFYVTGAMIYVDEAGKTISYDDVFTKIARARAHYREVGLGEDYLEQFIR